MDFESNKTKLRYQGYLNTPLLWNNKRVYGLEQFKLPGQLSDKKDVLKEISQHLLLGKLVERFVEIELRQYNGIKILMENVQIHHGKKTIGELDCVLEQDSNPIHLEIIYKFYLYDPAEGNREIDHWIGPNRNDTLLKKLNKLKNKQLPLISNMHTRPILERYNLKADNILQQVYFKAQLFVPHGEKVNFKQLNDKCLKGFYVHISDIERFRDSNFYIPIKADWLLEVHHQVKWLPFDHFQEKVVQFAKNSRSPLCWIKYPNGQLQKFFVVWWN